MGFQDLMPPVAPIARTLVWLCITVLLFAHPLHRLMLWPRWPAIAQPFLPRPPMVGHSGRQRWRIRPPALGRARALGGLGNLQRLAQACMGHHDMVRGVEQGLLHAVFALAQRGDTTSHRGHALTARQGEPLHQAVLIFQPPAAQPCSTAASVPHPTRGVTATRRWRRDDCTTCASSSPGNGIHRGWGQGPLSGLRPG